MKSHKLLFFSATLLLTILFPLNLTQANPDEYLEGKKMEMDKNKDMMNMDHEEHKDHEHKTLDISDNTLIPKIEIKAYKDSVKGWNLEIKTTNFTKKFSRKPSP